MLDLDSILHHNAADRNNTDKFIQYKNYITILIQNVRQNNRFSIKVRLDHQLFSENAASNKST